MKRYLLYLILCVCLFFVACSSIDEIDLSEESSMQQESNSIEREECNQDIVEDNLTFEDESEEADGEEPTEDPYEEQLSLWEQMLTSEELSGQDEQVLQRFYPIFCENKEFELYLSAEEEQGVVTLDEVGVPMYGEENGTFYSLQQFVLMDMAGDDKKELVVYTRELGSAFLVFFEEEGNYYCSFHPYRHMIELQSNGLYVENGAWVNSYYRMRFEDGIYEEVLAFQAWNTDKDGNVCFEGTIGDENATEEELEQWVEENYSKEAEWIYVG